MHSRLSKVENKRNLLKMHFLTTGSRGVQTWTKHSMIREKQKCSEQVHIHANTQTQYIHSLTIHIFTDIKSYSGEGSTLLSRLLLTPYDSPSHLSL